MSKKPRSTSTGSRDGSNRKSKGRSILWRARRALFLVGVALLLSIAGAGYVIGQVELPEADPLLESTFVCAADVVQDCGPDNAIATLAGEEDRVSLPISEVPQLFIDAVLAAEDRNFFSHNGIDPMGIARALYQDWRNPGATQGGSTITQQYAKNAFLTSERTLNRKFREAVLAIRLEREFSKGEILERYLNTVYFGRGAYGAEAAARAYYGISIREVSLDQAAYLAAVIRSPETTDASRNPDTARFRRDSVLDGMAATGAITSAERDAGKDVDLATTVRERSAREGLGHVVDAEYGTEFYVEHVRQLLYDEYGADVVNGGALRVYTSLDLEYQRAAYDAVYGTLDDDTDPAGALVSIDDVGRVVAMVGGKEFGQAEGASQVNLALGREAGGSGRGAGSAFKSVTLATALDQGLSVYSRFQDDNEMVFPGANAGEDWTVRNYAEAEERVRDLIEATARSSNTVYAQLIQEIGAANVAEMAGRLGVKAEVPAVASVTLGSGDVSVLDMANASSTLARRGEAVEPIFITKVEQVQGDEVRVLYQATGERTRVLDTNVADQVNWVLRQVVLSGTGTGADFGIPIAGKTGTTQDYRDAWFVGYTPRLTTAVWMGYPHLDADGNAQFMRGVRGINVSGGSFPTQIWRQYMQAVLAGGTHGSFAEPTFGGRVLNEDLQDTTTTLPICGEEDDADDDGNGDDEASSDTTAPCRTTTTTTEEPDETTTTEEPDETTTTEEPDETTTTEETTTTTEDPDPEPDPDPPIPED